MTAIEYPTSRSGASSPASREKPLRVLHVYSGNLFGGIERTFLNYVARPEPAWHTEFALCYDGQLREGLTAQGAQHHDLGPVRLRQPWTIARARRRLTALLTERHFDVVVSHSAWGQIVFGPPIRASGATFVFYLHDVATGTHVLERLARRVVPDLVVCNSQFTSATAPRLYPSVPTVVAYPAVGAAKPRNSATRHGLRASLDTPADDVVVVQASRMQEWKGHRLLLDALARVKARSRWTCWIAGGPQRPEEQIYFAALKARAVELGIAENVRFLGHRRDVADLFAAADVFCQPNVAPEPFGVVFIEALAAGLPVLSTRMGGAMEIIDETCGVLVHSEPDAVASALTTLIDSPATRERLGAAGPARSRLLTDSTRQVNAMVDAFRAAKTRSPRPIDNEHRAALSRGGSAAPIRELVQEVVRARTTRPVPVLVDLGCGAGAVATYLAGTYERYIGCDLVRYDGFPQDAHSTFQRSDLNQPPYPLAAASADLVVSVETIEHLENPRAFLREIVRILRPGGRVVLTTPNQLSLLSKLSLLTQNQFNAFQQAPGLYPSHITALVEEDLRRIAAECGLEQIEIKYTDRGRVPFTALRWPTKAGFSGRWFSDNVLLTAVRAELRRGHAEDGGTA